VSAPSFLQNRPQALFLSCSQVIGIMNSGPRKRPSRMLIQMSAM
jgi:hypothetical protein